MLAKMLFKSSLTLCQLRWYSTKPKVKLNESFNALLESKEAKHRTHPGLIKSNVIRLPERILHAMEIVLEDVNHKSAIYSECNKFCNKLNGRHVPMEQSQSQEKFRAVLLKLMKKKLSQLSDEEVETLCSRNRAKAVRTLKQQTNMWKAIVYDEYRSLLYMTGRSAQDYAVLYSIFNEIHIRDKSFKPETVFDFGSGIGTTMWAMKEHWPEKLKEFVNVDASVNISNLSEKIMKSAYPKFTGAFYRQYMPMSLRSNYDIVVCAYTLIELFNAKTRLDTVMKLWKKTKNYLVIVEQGTNAGFNLVSEARDFILHLSNSSEETENKTETAHVFAPCPHDLVCPRFATDNTPCNFEVPYYSLPLMGSSATKHERYSYVVLKKGEGGSDRHWPRIVRPTLKKGKHAICRMCSSSGNLEEIIFTPSKYGRNLYRCARVSKWGDRLPIESNVETDKSVGTQSTNEDKDEREDEIDNEESDGEIKT